MYKLNLKFPVVPKSLNKELRGHRYARSRSNHAWDLLVSTLVKNQLPAAPLNKGRIKIVRRFYRTLDYDGLVGSMKPVVDALVSAGVLKDDSWKTLGVWDVTQEFVPKSYGAELELWLTSEP